MGFAGLAYRNVIALIGKFGNGLDFERSEKYGWLTKNINLLGTGLCCKIRMNLQHTVEHIETFAQKSGIKINSVNTKQSKDGFNIVDLTNRRTFGLSEFECVQQFYDGIKRFLEIQTVNVEPHADTVEDSTEIDTNKLCANANESSDSHKSEVDVDEAKQHAESNLSNQNAANEQKINVEAHESDGNVEEADVVDNTDTVQANTNEPSADVEETNDGKSAAADEDNTTNELEPNNSNENNADNTEEKEIVNDEEEMTEITETAPIELNGMENEADAPPNPMEDQDTNETDNQPNEV